MRNRDKISNRYEKWLSLSLMIKQNYQQMSSKDKLSLLEKMFQKAGEKYRYTSEAHVEEYVDSIYKEIINGDIQVSKQRTKIQNNPDGKHIESAIRRKFLDQAQRQKYQLEHKLDYLSNSINSLKKYEEYKQYGNPKSLRESYSMGTSRMRDREWRQKIKERGQDLQKIKKEIEQKKNIKQEKEKEEEEKMKLEENEKRRQLILDNMKLIQARMKNREDDVKEGNERLRKVRKEKSMFQRISENYKEKQLSFLEEKKKKLAEIRNYHQPIDEESIREHENRFLELKKQKQEMREREKRMNESRSKSYKPFYESSFYKKIKENNDKIEDENPAQIKAEKMKQFYQHIKEHFPPQISQKKKQKIMELMEEEKKKEELKIANQKLVLQKSRAIGVEYLEEMKKIPKKRKKSVQEIASKTDRIHYQNYLTHHSRNGQQKRWNKILNSSGDKQTKALHLQIESEKMQQQLKRRQLETKVLKKDDAEEIDQGYYDMIKAKLDLLQSKGS